MIIGATSAIAEHCARLWITAQAVDLVLVGRSIARMDAIAADLRVRSPQSTVRLMQADFLDPAAIQATVDQLHADGAVDVALIAHGSLPEQHDCEADLSLCREALDINGISPVLYAEAFAMHMAQQGRGTLALIGSVAGDRGRKSNYVYGAAKGLVTRYAQGLQHRFAGTGVRIVLIKPGPTDTPMTAHLKGKGAKLASVTDVAASIVRGVDQGRTVVYVPGKWRLIMMVIIHMPGFVFNKLNI
ncbi:SDR family NAD(P)-dependent oxidoreductase [Noviherbaspirillum sp. DKR-6]|uniref:SDR family NAD(P)-dependent oxidoreductase n=1 Tax=Noviherbaspirillum pedocola TaxID=2801341 RepID=A0A934SQ19_9BURK|nr:SDR family NAD(P)-dependent oxidoreductase [Noviherbaspirillum pedocola]